MSSNRPAPTKEAAKDDEEPRIRVGAVFEDVEEAETEVLNHLLAHDPAAKLRTNHIYHHSSFQPGWQCSKVRPGGNGCRWTVRMRREPNGRCTVLHCNLNHYGRHDWSQADDVTDDESPSHTTRDLGSPRLAVGARYEDEAVLREAVEEMFEANGHARENVTASWESWTLFFGCTANDSCLFSIRCPLTNDGTAWRISATSNTRHDHPARRIAQPPRSAPTSSSSKPTKRPRAQVELRQDDSFASVTEVIDALESYASTHGGKSLSLYYAPTPAGQYPYTRLFCNRPGCNFSAQSRRLKDGSWICSSIRPSHNHAIEQPEQPLPIFDRARAKARKVAATPASEPAPAPRAPMTPEPSRSPALATAADPPAVPAQDELETWIVGISPTLRGTVPALRSAGIESSSDILGLRPNEFAQILDVVRQQVSPLQSILLARITSQLS